MVRARIATIKADIETRRGEVAALEAIYLAEVDGQGGNRSRGDGPVALAKKAVWEAAKADFEGFQAEQEAKIALEEKNIADLEKKVSNVEPDGTPTGYDAEANAAAAALKEEEASAEEKARHLDGLMIRIMIADEKYPVPSWALTLLMISIEMGPIFFKMMITKSVYEYLAENELRLRKAQAGIIPEAHVVMIDGVEHTGDRFLFAEALAGEEARQHDTEAQLAAIVHDEFRARSVDAIRADPRPYLRPVPGAVPLPGDRARPSDPPEGSA
jgi:hypothetical protein